MKRQLAQALVVAACGLGVGCGPSYERLDIDLLTDPPRSVALGSVIELSLGTVAVIRVEPISSSEDYDDDVHVSLESRDDSVLTVEPALEDHSFALIAMGEGETCVEVFVDHELEECLPAEVVDDLP